MKVIDVRKLAKMIAGNNYYSGDAILTAIHALVMGKPIRVIRPVEVEHKYKAMWVQVPAMISDPSRKERYSCTRCQGIAEYQYPRCPHCGAFMVNKK